MEDLPKMKFQGGHGTMEIRKQSQSFQILWKIEQSRNWLDNYTLDLSSTWQHHQKHN